MRWHGIFLAALSIVPAFSVFVDEAFHLDFHQALLGVPLPHATFFHKPDVSSNAALLYSVSHKAVLGAINPRDGSVVWRQALAGQPVYNATEAYLLAGEHDGKVTTAYGKSVASWDATNGRLIWTHGVKGRSKAVGLEPVPVLGSSTEPAVQDVVLLTQPQKEGGGHVVTRLSGDGSGERWHHSDFDTKLDATVAIATSPKHVYYISRAAGLLGGQKTKVTVLDIVTGKQEKEYTVSLDGEQVPYTGKLVSGSGSDTPFLLSSEKPHKNIKLNILGSNKIITLSLEDKVSEIAVLQAHAATASKDSIHLLLHAQDGSKHWAEVFHVNTAKGHATRAYSLPATQEHSSFSVSRNADKVFFTRITETEVIIYSSESHGQLARWPRKELGSSYQFASLPVFATAEIASKDTANLAARIAVLSPEGNWYLIRNGETQWSRPELLVDAEMATWSNDVAIDALAQELGTEKSADPATAYINRVYRHATELTHLPQKLLQLPQKILHPKDEASTRQSLVGSKSLILKTRGHDLFSIDAVHGQIDWHTDLTRHVAQGESIRSLASQEGRVTMYISDGSVLVVNATDGKVVENKAGSISAVRVIELPGSPASTIVKVDEDGVPRPATDLAPSVPQEGNIVITINKQGQAAGWTIGTEVKRMWTFAPSAGSIIDITSRPHHDPIASVGRVLGDRSVLYKYFTPNLALVTVKSAETLTYYLLDAVTGATLHSSVHAGVLASSPISSVISENWFAYTFTSSDPETKAISTQLIVSELYESDTPNDRGPLSSKSNYSSFDPDAVSPPHVLSAAFTLSEPITDLTVTQTTQGITTRHLLAYLPQSNVIASIPRYVLDARRPVDRDPTPAEAEEGLFRYQPNLELDPKHFLSHSREVLGIKQILTSPTLLESTSMVFAFGHDIFGTQVAPSQTFDVLGKSFKKAQLIATVVALYFGVLALRPLVRRKVVARGWS